MPRDHQILIAGAFAVVLLASQSGNPHAESSPGPGRTAAAPVSPQGGHLGSIRTTEESPKGRGSTPSTNGSAEGTSDAWLGSAVEEIRKAEYRFSVQEDRSWSAPNRAHGLRTRIHPKGVEVTSRIHGADAAAGGWTLRLELRAWGREGWMADLEEGTLETRDGRVELGRGDLREWYVNDEEGLEQGFTVEIPPERSLVTARQPQPDEEWRSRGSAAVLVLEMALGGDLLAYPTEDRQAIVFKSARGEAMLQYAGLLVTDALGAPVPAWMTVQPGCLRIVIEDETAVYPLTVDPLMGSPIWTAQGTQNDALFGWSVATAGDVNGDGYSDVLVGVPGFDAGHVDEGRVVLYLGSPSGPGKAANWFVNGEQGFAGIGYPVSTAGDVNRDGYDDFIVSSGSYRVTQVNEGAAFVWYGSAGGLGKSSSPSLAPWRMESDQPNSQGLQAAYAGDLNGDLYDDIVIGLDGYTNGEGFEGVAFVYLGSASGLGSNGNPSNADWRVEGQLVGAGMGAGVASAGDVNRDGYEDLIVGAPGYNNGSAFVYLGSATGLGVNGTPANADWRSEGAGITSVSLAGDVNGDGYGDIVVGAEGFSNGQSGEGAAFVFLGSASGPGVTPAWRAESNQVFSLFGASVATAGDANGDGFSDVAVGAYNYDNGETDEGAAFVWFGGPLGLGPNGTPANADWTVEGSQIAADLGISVATAGDVNGDGYSDLIVGTPFYDIGAGVNQGKASIYVGAAAGLNAQAAWSAVGPQVDGRLGQTVAGAGDVNGDGYSDVVVGVLRYDNGQTDEGAVFFYPGTASGLSASSTWSAEGDQAAAFFGSSVASAGDVNGDGYSDVIVASSNYAVGGTSVGAVFLWHGSASGLGLNGTPLNADWSVFGFSSGFETTLRGKSVASAGDVDGDGYSDVIIGGSRFPFIGSAAGTAYIHRGSPGGLEPTPSQTVSVFDMAGSTSFGASVASAGDVNGDGFSDLIVGASGHTFGQSGEGAAFLYLGSVGGGLSQAWRAEADQAGAGLGISVGSAGDVNGDGYSDVIIGASAYDNGQTDEGVALVWLGGAAGMGLNGNPTNADWLAESNQAGALFGRSVSGAGDFDADGYSDVLVGARAYDNGQTDEGAAFAYRGSASGLGTSPAWTEERDQAGSEFGHAVAMAGDVNGDGYGDVVIGAPSYDSGGVDKGLAAVHMGNQGEGRDRIPRQARADGAAPIDVLGRSESETLFRLRARGRTPAGRKNIILEYEIKPLGLPFDGTGLGLSANIVPVCSSGGCHVDFDELPLYSGILPGTHYHWRLRTSTFSPLFPRTPWISLPYNNRTETDLRTAGCHDLDDDGYGSPPDASCAGGSAVDCDDGLASVHPGATELCDGLDNNCDGSVDNNILAPAGSPTVTAHKIDANTYLTWTTMADATAYDVVRGSLLNLHTSAGNFTTSTGACLSNDLAANSVQAPNTPAPGGGSWYLVRSVNCVGAGTYDSGAPSQVGLRDAEIGANMNSCP